MAREDRNNFDPETQHRVKRARYNVVERFCNVCKEWFKLEEVGEYCTKTPECREALGISENEYKVYVNNGNCYKGWYEHIDSKPIWIESKAQLYHECLKRGKSARCLESGGVMKRPKGA